MRFHNGLDSLRRYFSREKLVDLTPTVTDQGLPSEISAITSSSHTLMPSQQSELLLTEASLV